MKRSISLLGLLCVALALTGCARSTIETRKKERYGAYESLKPEFQDLVNQGRIEVGMPRDAVYIAWGEPSETITSQSAAGTLETWVYIGTRLESHGYWTYGPRYGYYRRGHRYGYGVPYFDHAYYPVNYTAAEVLMEKDLVKSWRRLTPTR